MPQVIPEEQQHNKACNNFTFSCIRDNFDINSPFKVDGCMPINHFLLLVACPTKVDGCMPSWNVDIGCWFCLLVVVVVVVVCCVLPTNSLG